MKWPGLILSFLCFCGCYRSHETYTEQDSAYCQGAKLKNEYIVHWKSGQPTLLHETSLAKFLDKFNQQIDFVEPNYRIQTEKNFFRPMANELVQQSANNVYNMINVKTAWQDGYYGQGIIVALVDTGIDTNHPSLRPRIAINEIENAHGINGIDDDGNGFIDDIYGWNFVSNTGIVVDETGHGTAMAGVITGPYLNEDSLSLAPSVKILPVEFMDENGGTEFNAQAAIQYAISRKAQIINNSWTVSCSELLRKSFAQWGKEKVLFVNSSGNEPVDVIAQDIEPAALAYPNQINVGSLDDRGYRSSFSGYGATVKIYAPGEMIPSLTPTNSDTTGYAQISGTSVSTAIISAGAALLWSAYPNASAVDIVNLLIDGANQQLSIEPGLNLRQSLNLGNSRFPRTGP